MIFRKCFRGSQNGMILVDAMIGLSLAAFFIACISEVSSKSRQIFEIAHAKSNLMDEYESNKNVWDGMHPYESKTFGSSTAEAIWFGNDMVETRIDLVSSSVFDGEQIAKINFVKINSNSVPDFDLPRSTAFCTTDFTSPNVIGSFEYFNFIPANPNLVASTSVVTPIKLPVISSLPLTDIRVKQNILFISADSNTASDPDFLVFTISTSSEAQLVSSMNTGPGVSAISVAGNMIYGAAASTAYQVHVLKFDGANLALVNKYQLPLPYATATPPFGSSIFYHKGKVYIGTEKWDGNEFNIVDVSNPASPIWLGGFEVGSKVSGIFVRDNIAYLTAAGSKQFLKLDITIPSNPILIDYTSPSGWSRQEGNTVDYFEDNVSFGRTNGGFDITSDHELFLESSATSSMANYSSLNMPGGVYGVLNDRHYLFAISRENGREIYLVKKQGNKIDTNNVSYIHLPSLPVKISCDLDTLYVMGNGVPYVYSIKFNP